MKFKCKHCLWYNDNKCQAPLPQWIPMNVRNTAIGIGEDYANHCPLFTPTSIVEDIEN